MHQRQAAQPREQAPSNMQDMMKMHEQMMAEMKAADARLDALVKDMNAATGDAKVNAVAAVVTELVRQQKSMHDHMAQRPCDGFFTLYRIRISRFFIDWLKRDIRIRAIRDEAFHFIVHLIQFTP